MFSELQVVYTNLHNSRAPAGRKASTAAELAIRDGQPACNCTSVSYRCKRKAYPQRESACRYMANVMENSILVSKADGSDFKILIGVADTQTFGDFAPPSWDTPANYQEICYVGDMDVRALNLSSSAIMHPPQCFCVLCATPPSETNKVRHRDVGLAGKCHISPTLCI